MEWFDPANHGNPFVYGNPAKSGKIA